MTFVAATQLYAELLFKAVIALPQRGHAPSANRLGFAGSSLRPSNRREVEGLRYPHCARLEPCNRWVGFLLSGGSPFRLIRLRSSDGVSANSMPLRVLPGNAVFCVDG